MDLGRVVDHLGLEFVGHGLQGLEEKIPRLLAADAQAGGDHLALHAQVRVGEEGTHRGKVLRSAHLAEQADNVADHVPGGIPVQLLEQDGRGRLARLPEQVEQPPAGVAAVVAHQVLQQHLGGRCAQGGEDAGRLLPVGVRVQGGLQQLVEDRRGADPFEQVAGKGAQFRVVPVRVGGRRGQGLEPLHQFVGPVVLFARQVVTGQGGEGLEDL